MTLAIILASYLLGSIPFSYLVARRHGIDVRQVGSGNVGATNVMRSAGLLPGLAALVLDAGKGAAATVLARSLARAYRPQEVMTVAAVAATAAVLGHMFPVWIGFRGGKGVATGAGAFLPVAPLAAALGVAAFVIVLAITRYVSVGSMVGAFVLAGTTFATPAQLPLSAAASLAALLIAWKHRANIGRLRYGTERRLGASGKAA